MSIPSSPMALLPVPAVQAGAIALGPDPARAATPLDFLFVTSRDDFGEQAGHFAEQCKRTGVHTELVFVEDLPGTAAGEKLASLHQLNGDWQADGKITSSTIKIFLLHGEMREFPYDASVEAFWTNTVGLDWPGGDEDEDASVPSRAGDTAASADSDSDTLVSSSDDESGYSATSDTDEPAETDSDTLVSSDDESEDDAPEVDRIHCVVAAGLTFPTQMIDFALRSIKYEGGAQAQGSPGTIIYGSCFSGWLRDAFKKMAGNYVLATGKKLGIEGDFFDSIELLAHETARRKSEKQPSMSGRDCWLLMQDVAGEHIAYVGDHTVEIHKVLEAGHSEPVLSAKNPRHSRLAENVLIAKISHGSAHALRRAIDSFGHDALRAIHPATLFTSLASDEFHGQAELRKKMDVLRKAGVDLPEDIDQVAHMLRYCIEDRNWDLLSLLLNHDMPMAGDDRGGLPGTLIGWLLDMHGLSVKTSICEQVQQLVQQNEQVRGIVKRALFEHLLRCRESRQRRNYDAFPAFDKLVTEATLENLPGLPAELTIFVHARRNRHPDGDSLLAWSILWHPPADQADHFLEYLLNTGWEPAAARVLLDWLANQLNEKDYRRIVDDIFSKALFRRDFDAAASLIPFGCTPASLSNQSSAGAGLLRRLREGRAGVNLNELRTFFQKHGHEFVYPDM